MLTKQKTYSHLGRSKKALIWPNGEEFADCFFESLCKGALGKHSVSGYFDSDSPTANSRFLYKESSLAAAQTNADCFDFGIRTQRPYAFFFIRENSGSFVFENLNGINGRCVPRSANLSTRLEVAKNALSLLAKMHWLSSGFGVLHGDTHLANFVLVGVTSLSDSQSTSDVAIVDFDQSQKYSPNQRRFAPFDRDITKLEEDCSINLSLSSGDFDGLLSTAYLPLVPANLRRESEKMLREALHISRRSCTWGL